MMHRLALILALGLSAPAAFAQDATLADIRQQLTVLYTDVQRLRSELSTTGALTTGAVGNTPLDRLNAIESELVRLTSKSEEVENRVNRVTTDGTNRIGDLEFRLCELEPACDIGSLGDTPSLGGVDSAASIAPAAPAPTPSSNPQLAIGESEDFQRAQEALASGDFRGAADQLETFSTSYPGSAVADQAAYMRGEALEGLGEMTNAARAYLEAFSTNPTGDKAPDALYKLGYSLGAIGQVQDACVTLTEVGTRFPGSAAETDARTAMTNFACN